MLNNAAAGYRLAQKALTCLGLSTDELAAYPELKQEHLVAFTVHSQDEQRGDSKKKASWIWGDMSFVDGKMDLEEYMVESKSRLSDNNVSDLY